VVPYIMYLNPKLAAICSGGRGIK